MITYGILKNLLHDVLKQNWLDDIGKDNVLCTFDDRQKVVDMCELMVSRVFR